MKATSAFHSPPVPRPSAGEGARVSAEDLAALPLFVNLGEEFLRQVARDSKYTHFSAGQLLLSQGEIPEALFAIISGRARVDCNLPDVRLLIGEFGPGSVLGFSWMFVPEKVQFNVRAAEPVTAVMISGSALRELCENDPASGYRIAVRMGHELFKRLHSLVEMIGGESGCSKTA